MLHTDNGWKLAPGFDLTFSTGMGNEHTTTVSGSGKLNRKSLLKLAAAFAIKTQRANDVTDHVMDAVTKWSQYAEKYNVFEESVSAIEDALTSIRAKF